MPSDGPKVTCLGQVVILVFILGCIGVAGFLFYTHYAGNSDLGPNPVTGTNPSTPSSSSTPFNPGMQVEIGIAYGTEKKRWLENAVQQFAQTNQGKNIKVDLIPKGSLEGAQAILAGDQTINVWSPASSLYKDIFVQEWSLKYGNKNPIGREESLALTPMVFVFWSERYDAFIGKYKEVSFDTIGQALQEKGGWNAIAGKPEWGLFKFGHTHPNKSNSGLATLTLMAYEYQKKDRDLTLKDILDPAFQTWMNKTESAVSGLSDSTGNMMKDMVLRGPSSYDALFVYENVAIDYLKNAEGRWGELRIAYPKRNVWNDNPYYIVDAPWSTPEQKKAAGAFADFLLSEPIQKQSLDHGLRPGNPQVPVKFPESPLVQYQKYGLQIDIGATCEPPKAEVINNLLAGWQRSQGSR
jgi:ABC-type glycerol-3-phosphate transport system substrate-binding protein